MAESFKTLQDKQGSTVKFEKGEQLNYIFKIKTFHFDNQEGWMVMATFRLSQIHMKISKF